MRCLITGITGFTGDYLRKKLQNSNYEVFGTSFTENQDPSVFKCDITQKSEILNVLDIIKPDFIFHLAAISFVKSDPLEIYNTNVIGTLNLLDSLVELNIAPKKVIIVSSAAVYGNNEQVLSESASLLPVNHYGNSKLVMENMTINYFDKLSIIITRPFNYTGIGQNIKFLIPKIAYHYSNNLKSIELGNINVFREFNDVQDVTDIYLKLMESNIISEVINICSGVSYSIKNILDILNLELGYEMTVKINSDFIRKFEIKDLKGDNSKLKKMLNSDDLFKVALKDTLKKIIKKTQYNDEY